MSFSIWRSVSLYSVEVSKSSYLGGVDSYLRAVFSFGGYALILGGVFCTSGPPYVFLLLIDSRLD